jgi:pyruvate/2-oxoglutarate dehydrogenase complex dihydrolipoamide acyltransferase (E2) component
MKSRSNFALPLLLAIALAGASALANADAARCRSNVCAAAPLYAAPQGAARGPITAPRDPELEKQSLKSLEAARFYFYKRKPAKGDKAALERINKAIESRLLEILDIHPTFTKVDEVFFLLGEVYARGEQTEEAIKYLSLVVKEFPDSEFFRDAKKRLDELQARKEKP